MQEMLEMLLKRVEELEKRVEKYFSLLKVDNELDFILKGTYMLESDINKILEGKERE